MSARLRDIVRQHKAALAAAIRTISQSGETPVRDDALADKAAWKIGLAKNDFSKTFNKGWSKWGK